MKWQILLTPTALKLLSDISDRRIREKIGTVIDRLAEDPEKQGKALLGELSGLRSIRAVGQRYRIIYQIRGNEIVVVIVAVGIRRDGARDDIYNLAKKLFRLGLLGE
ncbi:type II toxin-antitoxin system mRNA interferase toxin, RelE/StbE family [Geobacter pelophilus]|uniref:Type II toxin-antitoxin system mRNA interferase toxin, RelE/StbE family n=1 Tax=Geoanaerobacter pelophilus TaxID=60036 RepID=A0AAW4LAR0_9BACT|nr:type II toxin-antitoxin system mRNA interferase toxin, RelE/StbE family [Geoanaerobacter pelophilus]MBT0665436.1 type II toxin-antitoxin system mRNA interferase toxin, RelE/StbE family [Geoanaerobacter pelophilus]